MRKASLKLSQTLGNASDFASLLSSEILSFPFTHKLAFLTFKKTQNNADQSYNYAIGCFSTSQWQASIFDPSHQYLYSHFRSTRLRLYHSSN